MPGGSSTMKEEPVKAGPPPSLYLGAAGGAMGGTGKDYQIIDPVVGPLVASLANANVAEGVH